MDYHKIAHNKELSEFAAAEETNVSLEKVIHEVSEMLLNNHSPNEQRVILSEVKKSLLRHYESVRETHLKTAEEFAQKIQALES